MKPLAKLLLTTLLLLTTIVGRAQNDERALAAAIDTIVRVFPHDSIVNKIVDEVYQKHSKSAYLATRIAKSYYNYNKLPGPPWRDFHKRDTARAFKYINIALKINNKYADAYVLASDILDTEGKRDEAMHFLQRGIDVNPMDSSLYIASAMLLAYTDADAAVAKLKELKKKDPNFPVDLQLGRLYFELYSRGGTLPLEEMAKHYGQAGLEQMNAGDLGAYLMALTYTNKTQRAYEVSTYAVGRFPEDKGVRQYHFYSLLGTQHWSEAIIAAEQLFAIGDSTVYTPINLIRYGEALNGAKRYEDALKQYDKVLQMPNASENNRKTVYSHIATTMSGVIDGYTSNGDYTRAIATYEKFLEERRKLGKVDASMLATYAGIFTTQAEELNGEEKVAALMKADKIYDDMVSEFPETADVIGSYIRFTIRRSIDPDNERNLTMPLCDKTISLILSKPEPEKNLSRLLDLYMFKMRYFSIVNLNKPQALAYADKILEYAPTNESALKIKEIFGRRK